MTISAPVEVKRWISWAGVVWAEDMSKSGGGYSGGGGEDVDEEEL